MQRFLYFLIAVGVLITVFLVFFPKVKKHEEKIMPIAKTENSKQENKTFKKISSIFVPYWADITDLTKESDEYDRYIYFGLETTADYGLRIKDQSHFDKFNKDVSNKDKWMTVIMTNTDVNIEVLKNKKSWEKIFNQAITHAEENKFNGIVMDLEMSVLPFENVVQDINNFIKEFSTKIHEKNIKLALIIYGDTFYRKRPYDLFSLNKYCDEIMVMAYDFHKSRGEPGPNFPFDRRSSNEGDSNSQQYDYDFKTMIKDFLRFIPPEKLTVVFGMYGYDWQVDEKKRPSIQAKTLTFNEIKEEFLNKCKWESCVIRRDDISKETEIDYINSKIENNVGLINYHIVWFEDEKSAAIKQKYLLEKGIGSVGYWAWGYF